MNFSSLLWFMMASARKPVPMFNCSADTCKARLIFSAAEPNSKTCKTIDVHRKLLSSRYKSQRIFRERQRGYTDKTKTHKSRWLGLEKNEADYNEYEPEKWFVFFQDVATLYNNNNNDNIILYIAHGSEHPAALYNLLVSG